MKVTLLKTVMKVTLLKTVFAVVLLQIPAAGSESSSSSPSTSPAHQPPVSAAHVTVPAKQPLVVAGKSNFYSYAGELFLSAQALPGNNAIAMPTTSCPLLVRPTSNPAVAVVRLYIMSYFPCGFWPRIITRFLGDETFGKLAESLYDVSGGIAAPSWRCWQTGLELVVLGRTVALRVDECSTDVDVHWSHTYRTARLMVPQEPDFTFTSIDISGMSVLEVIVPNETVSAQGVFVALSVSLVWSKNAFDHMHTYIMSSSYPVDWIRL